MDDAPWSDRLGVITTERFQAALDRFDLGTFVAAERVSTGNFGQNVFLTSTQGAFVFRGNPLLPWQFQTEQFMARMLSDGTSLSVPWPYFHETDTGIFGWEFAIMPRLFGLQLSERSFYDPLPFEEKRVIAIAMGVALAELQAVRAQTAGRFDPDSGTLRPFPASYREWVREGIDENLRKAMGINMADLDWADQFLAITGPAVDDRSIPCFVHGDFHTNNVVAVTDNGHWRITGIFDLMSSHVGDGEFDLARQFCYYCEQDQRLAQAFLMSYTKIRKPRPGFRDRLGYFVLSERLGTWEWAKRTGIAWWEPELGFRLWLESFLTAIPDLD